MKILLWFVSKDTTYLKKSLDILERQYNGLERVDSVTGSEIAQVDRGEWEGYDILLVVGAIGVGVKKIISAARQLNAPEEKLLGDWIACIPGFTLEKYRRLQRSRLSIFSVDCFGGLISHTLGLPFRSPFVNMWLNAPEYICFLSAPHVYMANPLVFKNTEKIVEDFDYPVFRLGSNVDLHMNHYRDFEAAFAKWNERKQRINWFNLFVMMYTEDIRFLNLFDALPYDKKVCFVPFKSDLDSAWYIKPEVGKDEFFWQAVHRFAEGKCFYYDPFDMLLYGKKTPLIDM